VKPAPWLGKRVCIVALPKVRRLLMTTYRAVLVLVLLAVVTAFTGCGGDEESATTTVTETVTETSSSSETPAGPAVAELQQVMTTLGYYSGPIDGIYGEATTEGVKAMQEDLGVTADGIYGPETHAALSDKATDEAASIVMQVQTVLADYGYYDGEIDGAYGPETQAAVKELQQDLGVTVDGRAGPETVNAFNEAVANGTITVA
jgi:peptidoglycan hydrolase-like protein with peptidoglycan-binding domain